RLGLGALDPALASLGLLGPNLYKSFAVCIPASGRPGGAPDRSGGGGAGRRCRCGGRQLVARSADAAALVAFAARGRGEPRRVGTGFFRPDGGMARAPLPALPGCALPACVIAGLLF